MRLMTCKPRLLALGLWALGLPALAQVQLMPGQGDTEVHKCVRAGEIFYTNGACPSGTSEVKLGAGKGGEPRVRTVPATPTAPITPAAPVAPVPGTYAVPGNTPVAPSRPAVTPPPPPVAQPGMITITPSAQRRAAQAPAPEALRRPAMVDVPPEPVERWTNVQPGSLGGRRPAVAPQRAEVDVGPRPLSAFPPLPESDAGRRAERAERSDRADRAGTVVQVEEPMRGANRSVEAMPTPDARANNQAMCGFVNAEMTRLSEEARVAGSDDVRVRIAGQQQRLKARHTQLKC